MLILWLLIPALIAMTWLNVYLWNKQKDHENEIEWMRIRYQDWNHRPEESKQ